jgi:hypothetical protein
VNLSIITLKPGSQYNLRYVLGILNSTLINYLFRYRFVDHRIKNMYLDIVPIKKINLFDPAEKAAHDRMVSLIEQMLALHKRSARTPQEKEMIQREIESTDRAIDALVYELYGLTEDEVKIVERG